ncbi:Na(+)/H(+) exchange regulatory cofactor NHE-RF3 [Pseudophryne corroboree]|uniref:Na(+)/H(+) exchange regulatory cofactor NHE-RF3 n=1 Tax=Pseudophryne corroboree TaxID=495146 RepID=UPI003081EBA9
MSSNVTPRELTVTKQDGKGYGFFLRVEKDEVGHLVRSVENGSVADKAGLKDGDRVLKVNGVFVDDKEHPEVVNLIVSSGNTVSLSILDEASYLNAKKNGSDLSGNKTAPPAEAAAAIPTLCYLVKDKGSFGFSLKTLKGTSGVYLNTTPGGPAAKSGIQQGDRIIEVNGKNIEGNSYDQVVTQIKESGDSVMFLVVDKATDNSFQQKKTKITADQASVRLLPNPPRTVEMTKNPDGYGFYLRQEKVRKGHFIVDIDPKSPAEKANLKDYDRIVAINGECAEQMQHEQVVEAIRKGGNKTTLLVADKATDELYAKAGLSPFIYLKQSEVPTPVKEAPKPTETPATQPAPVPAPAAAAPAAAPAASPAASAPTSSPDPNHKPRLCRVKKGSAGFGFNLNAIKEVPGQYLKQVGKGGPADVAGIKEDDILVEVNGVNVMEEAYDDVVMRIKQAGAEITLLVVSPDAHEHFKAQNIQITASMADPLPKAESTPSADLTPPPSKAKPAPEPIVPVSNHSDLTPPPSKAKPAPEPIVPVSNHSDLTPPPSKAKPAPEPIVPVSNHSDLTPPPSKAKPAPEPIAPENKTSEDQAPKKESDDDTAL